MTIKLKSNLYVGPVNMFLHFYLIPASMVRVTGLCLDSTNYTMCPLVVNLFNNMMPFHHEMFEECGIVSSTLEYMSTLNHTIILASYLQEPSGTTALIHSGKLNSLAPGKCNYGLELVIFKLRLMIDIVSISCKIIHRRMPIDLTGD